MIRIRTPSRLHFGLLSVPSGTWSPWPNQEGKPTLVRRNFGGVGLMIEQPGVELVVEKAEQFSATGPLAERALDFARTCARGPFQVHVESAAPEHMGLGAGTQLGLAVARAIAHLTGQSHLSATMLAHQIGRGRRSAIGVYGFDHGGILVEGGKADDAAISPLIGRYAFPSDWRVLLIFPPNLQGTHGPRELSAFAELERQPCCDRVTETMSRLVLLGMLPALIEHDIDAFGEAVYDYNRRAGEMFQSVQGGIYAHAWTEAAVKVMRELGIKGVGQSSWGPVVFAIVAAEDADRMRDSLKRTVENDGVVITSACNRGALVSA